jgi:modulator of FtsH protease
MELSLFAKVALLLTGSMCLGGVGAFFGRNIKSIGAYIGLVILFIFGTIGVYFAAHASAAAGLVALTIWVFISGLVLGPTIQMYAEKLGWHTVMLCYFGTGGVMAVCGAIGALSGINFSSMGTFLFIALLGLVVFGVVTIFVKMSRTVNIIHAIIGMVIFSGYFIFDFFRLSKESNTWEHAINLAMSIYLDFINFFLYLLQLYAALHDKK